MPDQPHLLTGPVTFPTGHTLTAELAAAARDLYTLAKQIFWDETQLGAPHGPRDQDAYLTRHKQLAELRIDTIHAFLAEHPDTDAHTAIAHTHAGPRSYDYQSMFSPNLDMLECAVYQTGYLTLRLEDLAGHGLTGELAWTHLALETHPTRYGARAFFHHDPA